MNGGRVVFFLFACLVLPAAAAPWGRLFYSAQERAAMTNASAPGAARDHIFSAQTIADGHIRHWVDAASQPDVHIPRHVRVGDTWRESP